MLLRQIGVLLGVLDSDIVVREIGAFNEYRWVFCAPFSSPIKNHSNFIQILALILHWDYPPSTRLVLLVSGGPGRPPLSGRSVALSLRNKLRKQKNDFLIFKARRVDTVSTYGLINDSSLNSSDASFLSVLRCFDVNNLHKKKQLRSWSFSTCHCDWYPLSTLSLSLSAQLLGSRRVRPVHATLCLPPVLDGELHQSPVWRIGEQLWWV